MTPDDEDVVMRQMDIIDDKSMTYREFEEMQRQKDMESLQKLFTDPVGRKAYAEKYNLDPELLDRSGGRIKIPDSVFSGFYEDIDINIDIEL